jgi:hypothetical protein
MISWWIHCPTCGRDWPVLVDAAAQRRLLNGWPHLRCICGGGSLQLVGSHPPHASPVNGDGPGAAGRLVGLGR